MKHDVNQFRPPTINHVIGQTSVKKQVSVALEAAWNDQTKFDNSMLVGPPGLGKSALAQVIADEMGGEFNELLGQSLTNPADLYHLLMTAPEKSVVHIDECHLMKKEFQTALYLAIDQKRVVVSGGKASIPIQDFTLLVSTTDEYGLLQPLRDRMKLRLRFEYYNEDELVQVVAQRCQGLGWQIDECVLPSIASRSRGTPRLALRLLQSCRRVCRSKGMERIEPEHLATTCDLEQMDSHGLDRTEQQYLQLLADGPVRLNVIASVLGLPRRTIADVTESFLIRSGLVSKDDQGRRQLTAAGLEAVSANNEEAARRLLDE